MFSVDLILEAGTFLCTTRDICTQPATTAAPLDPDVYFLLLPLIDFFNAASHSRDQAPESGAGDGEERLMREGKWVRKEDESQDGIERRLFFSM